MYIFRADGNAKTGAGHLMRCLTIADALAAQLGGGEDILFLCADEASAGLVLSHGSASAELSGFQVRVLNTDHNHMEQELSVWEEISEQIDLETCVILVDSYFATDDYLKQIRKYGYTILLDDMQQHCFPVDAVVNYNAFADTAVYEALYKGTGTELYIGSRYVPVRRQFLGVSYEISEEVKNVLITTGGGDVDNIASVILRELDGNAADCTKKISGIDAADDGFLVRDSLRNYHVIIGRFHPKHKEWEELAAADSRIHVHSDVRDMAGLMRRCDLAITAGGTTIYELAAVGVPFLCFSYAENQELLTQYIGNHDIAGFAGAYHKDARGTLERMKELFLKFCADKEMRNKCYLKERSMIDGHGARRLASEMMLRHGKGSI